MNQRLRVLLLVILFALPALACNSLNPFAANPTLTATTAPAATPTSLPTVAAPVGSAPSDVALIDAAGLDFAEQRVIDVYERVSPSVVNITTRVLRRNFFFDAIPEEGVGSGFVIDGEGHIATNFHVVDGAETITVSFDDQVGRPATLVGADPRNDLAVLRVESPPELLVPATLGRSDNLQVGQRAVAIGNPFGQFERTLTTGVISALDRSLQTEGEREISGLIQTDTAINRGNSGGPLLDSAGRVIGINTAIFSPTGTSAGVGFAVPVETLQRVLPDLIELGYYRRPWLGIRYAYALSPGLAEALDLPVEQGLLLVQLVDGAPLATQGVRGARREAILGNQRVFLGGDILTEVDGRPVTSQSELDRQLETTRGVGDVVSLTLIRDGQPLSLQVTLSEAPR